MQITNLFQGRRVWAYHGGQIVSGTVIAVRTFPQDHVFVWLDPAGLAEEFSVRDVFPDREQAALAKIEACRRAAHYQYDKAADLLRQATAARETADRLERELKEAASEARP